MIMPRYPEDDPSSTCVQYSTSTVRMRLGLILILGFVICLVLWLSSGKDCFTTYPK